MLGKLTTGVNFTNIFKRKSTKAQRNRQDFCAKAARKMLVKLTKGQRGICQVIFQLELKALLPWMLTCFNKIHNVVNIYGDICLFDVVVDVFPQQYLKRIKI